MHAMMSKEAQPMGRYVGVYGWGRTGPGTQTSDVLLMATNIVMEDESEFEVDISKDKTLGGNKKSLFLYKFLPTFSD